MMPRCAAACYQRCAELGHLPSIYKLARLYYKGRGGLKRDFGRAAGCFEQSALLGHAPSMFQLALMRLHGAPGVPRDFPVAASWLQQAAEAGSRGAARLLKSETVRFALGVLHEEGREGRKKDDRVARQQYLVAATGKPPGHREAQYRLGCLAATGTTSDRRADTLLARVDAAAEAERVAVEAERAAELWRAEADLGPMRTKSDVNMKGQEGEDGDGGGGGGDGSGAGSGEVGDGDSDSDSDRGGGRTTATAALGAGTAIANDARVQAARARATREAAEWWARATAQGHAMAAYRLGRLYQQDRISRTENHVPGCDDRVRAGDDPDSSDSDDSNADGGDDSDSSGADVPGYTAGYGDTYGRYAGGYSSSDEDPEERRARLAEQRRRRGLAKAALLFELAGDTLGSVAAAQHSLGLMWEKGQGVKGNAPSNAQAVHWYRRAAQQGDPEALNSLAFMYVDGLGTGVGVDLCRAEMLFIRAAAASEEFATDHLRLLLARYEEEEDLHEEEVIGGDGGDWNDDTGGGGGGDAEGDGHDADGDRTVASSAAAINNAAGDAISGPAPLDVRGVARRAAAAAARGRYMLGVLTCGSIARRAKETTQRFRAQEEAMRAAKRDWSTATKRSRRTGLLRPRSDKATYHEAGTWFLAAAEHGMAKAQNELACLLLKGRVPPLGSRHVLLCEPAKSLAELACAEERAHDEQRRRGVKRTGAQEHAARIWFQRAAAQHHPGAQYHLARMYANAQGGLRENKRMAVKLYRKSADQGHCAAAYNLGLQLYKLQKFAEAASYYRRAAILNDKDAQFNLGVMYEQGRGVPHSLKHACKLYIKAANRGHAEACFYMGLKYQDGCKTSGTKRKPGAVIVKQDVKQAIRYFRVAAEKGIVDAAVNIGVIYKHANLIEGGAEGGQDPRKALRWFKKAAARGDAKAAEMVEELKYLGISDDEDAESSGGEAANLLPAADDDGDGPDGDARVDA